MKIAGRSASAAQSMFAAGVGTAPRRHSYRSSNGPGGSARTVHSSNGATVATPEVRFGRARVGSTQSEGPVGGWDFSRDGAEASHPHLPCRSVKQSS